MVVQEPTCSTMARHKTLASAACLWIDHSMTLQIWLSFVAAATILLLIPGPTVLQCIGDALANRQRQNWSTILGVGTGDAVAMSLSLVGAGALLQTSARAFTVMK